MTQLQHRVLRASAGTGKTHTLALRFLQLLLAGVEPERILATTFTKKAAGEILERVFERLVEAALDGDKLAVLVQQLEEAGAAGAELTQASCEALVARLARRLDRFQVRTLDSFFAQVARLYAYELGLPEDWRAADEAELEDQGQEAVGQLLLEEDSQEKRQNLLELLRELQGQNPANSVSGSLLKIVASGLSVWRETAAEAWERVVPPPAVDADAREQLLRQLREHPLPQTKAGKPNGHWQKALASNLADFEAERWEAFLGKGLAAKVAEGETQFRSHEMCEDLLALMRPLIQHAGHHLVSQVVERNRAARQLLERYHGVRDALQRESGVLGFDDVPQAIAPRGADDLWEERDLDLWFRLDGRVDHLLLDEFQDTSPLQWRILRRLADEILSEGDGLRSFFCVGDGKQSIYGFRYAEPRLLEALGAHDNVEKEELTRSFRSAQVVLDVVNDLFTEVPQNPAVLGVTDDDADACRAGVAAFAGGYSAHQAAKQELRGTVLLLQPESEEGDDQPKPAEAVIELAAQRILALVREAPGATVGVLFRRRKWIPTLLRRLDELNVSASGEGGNPLTDAKAVVEALALLHFADHPGDTAAAYHVVQCGLGAPFGLTHDSPQAEREAVATRLRARLTESGLGPFLASLEPTVAALHPDPWQQGRFRQLVQLAHAQDEQGRARPTRFVRHVRQTRVESSTPAPVKVMTVHGSKGLQFDAVVLPELDEPVLGRPPSFLALREEPTEPITTVSHSASREVRSHSPVLQTLWADHVTRGLRESMCLLYVAATRAKTHLELLVQPEPTGRRTGSLNQLTWASMVRGALQHRPHQDHPDIPGALILHARWSGSPQSWREGLEDAPAPPDTSAPELALGLGLPAEPAAPEPSSATRRRAAARTRAERLAPRSSRARRLGLLVHRLLEEVEWLEDFELSADDQAALLAPLDADAALRKEALATFQSALDAPALRAALTRAEHPHTRVEREARFCLTPTTGPAAGRLIQGAMDRVHVRLDRDQPVSACVYDFKLAAESEDLQAAYADQLKLYRHALAARLGLAPEAVEAVLLPLVPAPE